MFGRSISYDANTEFGFWRAYLGVLPSLASSEEERAQAQKEIWVDSSPTLYHYTSPSGLMGIIKSGGFWVSDNRFMNDSEELVHGLDFATNFLSRNIQTSTLVDFTAVLEIALNSLKASYSAGQLVACFSLKRDSLEQWRGYGRSGGVCIELSTTTTDCAPLFREFGLTRQKVFYEKKDKEAFLLLKMLRFLKELIADQKKFGGIPSEILQKYGEYLARSMSNAIAGFKNSAFSSEAEVRIVCPFETSAQFTGGLRFRESDYGPIAYVNTADFVHPPGILASILSLTSSDEVVAAQLPIISITVGPSARQALIVESVRTFMRESGYPEVEVTPSTVPFRGF